MTVPARIDARDALNPLADSVRAASSLVGWLEIRYERTGSGAPDGWTRCADLLAAPDGFAAWRAGLAEWMEEQHGGSTERATAGYVLGWYLGAVGMLGGALFHRARRVPSLRPQDVALRLADAGRPDVVGVALLAGGFACLPSDPASNHPEATVVADESALAALLRARFAAHAAAFTAAYGPTTRLGRRALWAAATDALDSSAWLAGLHGGDEAAGVADSALLLPFREAPYTSATTLRVVDGTWTRRRESCCFHFTLPGAQACETCPRVCGK
ncbi:MULTISPECIES: (2Fe-2S)-binding protein [Actinosynnema]|uniref:(2Fe-2S)-binding protein n=1 Tax=Actinosynnema TaxID=40566 RepID=UPI0020A3DCFD|nr:(2Fe-2S)-binding protein [Actinosynnema pretiosum]MCP2096884.1 Ferric iron reductase FhuF-like transporter [Actinosynnema pretiosum]